MSTMQPPSPPPGIATPAAAALALATAALLLALGPLACQSPSDGLAPRPSEHLPHLDAPPEPAPPTAPAPPPVPTETPFGQNDDAMLEGLDGEGALRATLTTTAGNLHCTLFPDEAPRAVTNFIGLATGRKAFVDPTTGERIKRPFYDGLPVHRVVPDYLFQFGDPTGSGTYSPGYRFADEHPTTLKADKPGVLAMANTGPDTNGSQVFVTAVAEPHIETTNTLFGQCDAADLPVIRNITSAPLGPYQRPLEAITILAITFERTSTPTEPATPQ